MSTLNDYTFDSDPPTFYEVLQAAKDAGLVGEEDTLLTLVLGMVRGHLIVMTGPARAGKDEAVDAAETVYDAGQQVYKWPTDDSPTAAYYNRDEINQYPIHRFPDLARLEPHHEKILKAFGEGRDATRDRTDISEEQAGRDAVEDQVIYCPRTTIAFIASDNEQIDLNDYPELRNRALLVDVDASEDQTSRVNRRKAEEHAGLTERQISPLRLAQIRDYHTSIPVDEWINNKTNQIINPSSVNIHEQEPIPELFPEARQDFDRLLEFVETVTLYHYVNRQVVEFDQQRVMLSTPTDVWVAMTILGNKMVMSALNLTKEDRAILTILEEARTNKTKADIQQMLRMQGFNVTDRDVARSLDSMRGKGYVRVHQGNPNEYSLNDFASVAHHDVGLDYEEIVSASRNTVYDVVPDDAADEYVERFCRGDGLITTHPFTGEAVDITERDELGDLMDDGIEDIETVFDKARSKYETTEDNEEPNAKKEAQRKL